MMNRRIWAVLLALALCAGLFSVCLAETEYPPRPQGSSADLAGVLGESTVKDLDSLNQKLEETTGGHIYVLTRHFLGGMSAQNYADQVFKVWTLNENDALLLLVIGEESYALALGSGTKLSQDTQTSLLASHLRAAFLNRQYDAAVSDFALNAAQVLAKAGGKTLDAAGLFGKTASQTTPQPVNTQNSWESMFARDDYTATESDNDRIWQNWQNERKSEETRTNWRSVIIWGLVIYFLFFRKRRRQKGRR